MTDNAHAEAGDTHPGKLEDKLKSRSTWLRFLYMLLFSVFYGLALMVISVIVIFQFLMTLFTGEPNANLLGLGKGLSRYAYQVLMFLTFNTEDKPFPFADWPADAED